MPRLLEHLDRLPPWACRLLARERRREIPTREIARRSGLNKAWINRLSRRRTWSGISVGTADAFYFGCGIDPFQMRRHFAYIRRLRGKSMAHARGRYGAFVRRILAEVAEAKTNQNHARHD